MAQKPTLVLSTRLAPDIRNKFAAKAAKHGGASYILREMIRAFVENRITIKPPKENIYEH